jgi:hypothetical protein
VFQKREVSLVNNFKITFQYKDLYED